MVVKTLLIVLFFTNKYNREALVLAAPASLASL
jgi:hypothetical protein